MLRGMPQGGMHISVAKVQVKVTQAVLAARLAAFNLLFLQELMQVIVQQAAGPDDWSPSQQPLHAHWATCASQVHATW